MNGNQGEYRGIAFGSLHHFIYYIRYQHVNSILSLDVHRASAIKVLSCDEEMLHSVSSCTRIMFVRHNTYYY